MELSVSAKKIITNAQAFRVENDHNSLFVEHLLYGVLLMGKENSNDGRKVSEYLRREMQNPEAALTQLKADAKQDSSLFKDAAPVLGRATELAGGGEIGAMTLAQAVMESDTPTILALKGLRAVHRQPAQKKPEPEEKERELSEKELAMLLLLMAAANNSQKDELVRNTGSRGNGGNRGNGPKVRRRTKMGPFTYRGGTAAAAFQYFLFGILVPVALIVVLQHFTDFLGKTAPPFLMFVEGTVFCLWMFYLARGAALLFGILSGAFGNFLNILFDIALIAAEVRIIQTSWRMPVIPVWLRIIASAAVFLVLTVGAKLYDYLKDEGDVTKAKFTFMNLRGTPSKIFFQYVTKIAVYPFFVLAIIWIFRPTLPNWLGKTLMIMGFCYFWNVLNTMCSCLVMSCELHGGAGRGFLIFVKSFITSLFIPALVAFLYNIFMWGPMKTWVMIVLAIYLVLSTILSIVYSVVQQ